MRAWILLPVIGVALLLVFRLATTPTTLSAVEADTVAAGSMFAEALTAEGRGGMAARLKQAFAPDPKHPRVRQLPPHEAWRGRTIQPPLPRWLAGLSVATAPFDDYDTMLDRARWGGAFGMALALVLLGFAAWRERGVALGLLAVGAGLCLPGVWDAGAGPGGEAAPALAMGVLVLAMHRMTRRDAGGLLVGAAWGLCLACTPVALFLLVPIFAAAALARRGFDGAPPEAPHAAELALPPVRLTVFAIPVVGVLTLAVLWPALWEDTTKGLAIWMTDSYRRPTPLMEVAAFVYDQPAAKGPAAWTPLVQWVGWTPLPILAAWFVGLLATVRDGARGWWFPVLALVTVLVSAGVGGTLFPLHESLLPLLWVPTACTAAVGAVEAARWLADRSKLTTRLAVLAVAAIVAVPTAVAGMLGAAPMGTAGAETRQPLPVGMIREIARQTPWAAIAVVGGGASWKRHFEVMWSHVGAELGHHEEPDDVVWLVVIDEPGVPAVDRLRAAGRMPEGPPTLQQEAGGMTFKAWKLK